MHFTTKGFFCPRARDMIVFMNNQTKTHHILRNIGFAFLGTCALLGGVLLVWISLIKLPDFSSFDSRKVTNSTKIYDRTGTIVLYDLGQDAHRTSIPYTDMGTAIKNATVAIEDSNFYQNFGIEPKAMIRALIADITHVGAVQGGSTITQQVIKKSLLSDDKTIVRKLKEVVLALKLEHEYTKDQILGAYLNEIPYGGNVYGIQEAAQSFFGKNPSDLTLAEAAYLAAIPNAPTHYSPYGSHRDDLVTRKNFVLSRERDLSLITDTQFTQAKNEEVVFKPQQSNGIKAPHFVFFIKDYLEQKYGADVVESGGLKVISTLDYDLQQSAEKAVTEYTTGDKKQIDKENAGLIAIDPKTGQLLAMVGSRNYFDTEIDGNFNVTTAQRQPGSSFKPFMYATAFEDGYTPETSLFDVPTEFNAKCDPYGKPYPGTTTDQCYMPQNYDQKYHGPMTIREALARSMNVPAVKMLYMVGVQNAIKTAQDMGITTLSDSSRYGLALVLGGGEVKLLEMVSAYSDFAAEGVRHPYSSVLSVQDKNGNTLESWQDNPVTVLPKDVSLTMSDILSDNTARTPTFGANSSLYFPDHQVAVKTGTTNDYKDSWAIGYTPSLTAGVWVGKNDNTSMPVAVTASPVWHAFMEDALKKYPNETFDKPAINPNYTSLPPVLRGYWQGGKSFIVDTVSGKLATDKTPLSTQKEYVITDVHDILHWVNKTDPTNGTPTNPENDALYNNFETAVQNWWAQNYSKYPSITESQKPAGFDDIHTSTNTPHITIGSPRNTQSFKQDDQIPVIVSETGQFPLQKIEVFLNNSFVGSTQNGTPLLTFTPSQVTGVVVGENKLSVTGTDTAGNTVTTSLLITITD